MRAGRSRNVGIFGTVGSGKSNTTQVLMEEALKAGWAVAVVDVEGEYVKMDLPTDDAALQSVLRNDFNLEPQGVTDLHVYVPSSGTSDASNPIPFKVPMCELPFEVLGDILEMSEPQQRMFGAAVAGATAAGARAATGGGRRGALGGRGGPAQGDQRLYTPQTLIDGLFEDQQGDIPLLGRALQGQVDYRVAAGQNHRCNDVQMGARGS